MNHISRDQIIAFAAGELSGPDAEAVAAHVAQSPKAAETVRMYQRAANLRATDDSVQPPANAMARAKAIFPATKAATWKEWPHRLQEIVAAIVWDSRLQAAPLRRAGASGFQIAAEAQEAELAIDLNVQRNFGAERAAWRVTGQIDPAPLHPMQVEFRNANGAQPVRTETDADGVFAADLVAGQWQCVVRSRDASIVVGPLEMG